VENPRLRSNLRLRAGDWVEVRSREEILLTLDENGCLDNLPFMPEMFAFCGQRFQVYKRAHKTCDTVFPVRGRRVERTVHLETRCDGHAHGGCQARCLLFWKVDWLKPVGRTSQDQSAPRTGAPFTGVQAAQPSRCDESNVWARSQCSDSNGGIPKFICQATQLPYVTKDLAWWDVSQYFEDYVSGNVGLRSILNGFVYSIYYHLSQAGIGLGPAMRWLYDKFHPLWSGTQFPRKSGNIPVGEPTPTATLGLQPGELVRIKPFVEILSTLNTENKNRGLFFDAEMVPYCGGTYRVLQRVSKIIDEKTGEMQEFKNPCITLDSVICQSRYSYRRMFCPRSIYSFWREIWLERIAPDVSLDSKTQPNRTAQVRLDSQARVLGSNCQSLNAIPSGRSLFNDV